MNNEQVIIDIICAYLPDVRAIYLFGTWGTKDEWPDSDIDIALLLNSDKAKKTGLSAMSNLRVALESALEKEVDLINISMVSTVFQKEIIITGRRIYCADEYGTDEFEMVALSLYQKLNAERGAILEEALKCGRFYNL